MISGHELHIFKVLSSLFENLRYARDKTLVCKNRNELKLVKHNRWKQGTEQNIIRGFLRTDNFLN